MSSQIKLSTPRMPRHMAIVVHDGMEHDQFTQTLARLEQMADVHIDVLGSRLGSVCCTNGHRVAVDATLRRWPGAHFDAVYVMVTDEVTSTPGALIEDVFIRSAVCAGAMVVNVMPHGISNGSSKACWYALKRTSSMSSSKVSTLARVLAPTLLWGGMCAPAFAEDMVSLVVDPGATNVPYAVDSSRAIVRSGSGQCWRTGTWMLDAAASTKVTGSEFPAGCYCDKSLLPKEVCEPKPVVMPATAPAEQPMMAPPSPAAPVPQKVSVPADALFAFDKAQLTSAGRTQLGSYADQIKMLDLESVVAVGHTDRIGSEKYNMKLSERRAAAVKAFLIEQGISAQKVFIEGKGESQPVTGDQCSKMGRELATNHKLVDCLSPDRRVDIEAVGLKR